MTKKEALRRVKGYLTDYFPAEDYSEVEEIIEALKQEPFEDCISRQAVLDLIIANHVELNGVNVVMYSPLYIDIKQLPPVTPQPKVGQWIKSRDSYGNNHFTCPFCENDIATKYDGIWKDNYCSNCGAKLESKE